MRRSVRTGVAVLAASGLALTGCGGSDSGTTDGASATPADVVARGNDALKWDQKSYSAAAGSVTIQLVNDGALPHTLLIEKVGAFKKLSVTGKGQTATGTATLEPGTYTIFCDVAGHRSAGMEAQLVIS